MNDILHIGAAGILLCLGACEQAADGDVPPPLATAGATAPRTIAYRRHQLLDVGAEEWASLCARFAPRLRRGESHVVSPSILLHSVKLHGRHARFDDSIVMDADAAIDALCDSDAAEKVFRLPILKRTRFGARFRPPTVLPQSATQGDESHIDQTLAGLLELGVPLDREIRLAGDGERASLAAVLRDAIANFSLRQPEIEWTAMSIAYAAPAVTRWTNKFDEACDLDALAMELVRRPLERHGCCGAHLVQAMVVLEHQHRRHFLLTPESGAAVGARLRSCVGRMIANQLPDGSWDVDWHVPGAAKEPMSDESTRCLVTGHLAECLLLMPDDLAVETAVLERAGTWLLRYLRTNLSEAALRQSYCPLTHAAVVVRQLRRETPFTWRPREK